MPTTLLLRHTRGSRAGTTDTFAFDATRELVLGRDPATCQVVYDATKDDLVGRQHARIARVDGDTPRFTVTDLQSRNGTFVNRQRVSGTMPLAPGDTIQLGAGGPEFEFLLDPMPASAVPPTRVAGAYSDAVPATRVAGAAASLAGAPIGSEVPPTGAVAPAVPTMRGGIGMQTLGVVLEGERSRSRRTLFVSLGALTLLAGGAGAMVYQQGVQREKEFADVLVAAKAKIDSLERAGVPQKKIPEIIRKIPVYVGGSGGNGGTRTSITSAVVTAAIDSALKAQGLVTASTPAAPDTSKPAQGKSDPVAPNPAAVAATTPPPASGTESAKALSATEIAARYRMSVVKIRADWRLVDVATGQPLSQCIVTLPDGDQVGGWVRVKGKIEPALTTNGTGRQIASGGSGSGFVVSSSGMILTNRHVASPWQMPVGDLLPGPLVDNGDRCRPISNVIIDESARWTPTDTKQLERGAEGQLIRLRVLFDGSSNPIEARLVRSHPEMDIALIKIDATRSLVVAPPVDIEPKPGDPITIMGYPGISIQKFVEVRPRTLIYEPPSVLPVANATVTTASIGLVTQDPPAYQMTTSATGSGNSGGPVFDQYGRVIGIHTYGKSLGSTAITIAIPIKGGIELLK